MASRATFRNLRYKFVSQLKVFGLRLGVLHKSSTAIDLLKFSTQLTEADGRSAEAQKAAIQLLQPAASG